MTGWAWEINNPVASTVLLQAGAVPQRIDLCVPQLCWHTDRERLLVICPPGQNLWMLPTPYVSYTLPQLAEMFADGDRPLLLQLGAGSSLADVEVAALQVRARLGAGCLDAQRDSLRSLWPAAVHGWPGRSLHASSFELTVTDTGATVALCEYVERHPLPAPPTVAHGWLRPADLLDPDQTGAVWLYGRSVAADLVSLLHRTWSNPDPGILQDPG